MMLQILVNHYNEDLKIVKNFLDSLNTQENVSFEVIIASDGGNIKLSNEVFTSYNFPIKYMYLNHAGVCHTRNVLLDNSSADYIMFCDIDDMFIKEDGLNSLVSQIKKQNKPHIIGSPYTVERLHNNEFQYAAIEKDTIRVHGKIFNRNFLIKNQIRFPDELEFNGDMMFLWLAYAFSTKTQWINNNFYLWKWNKNSVTRTNREFYRIRTFPKTIKCYTLTGEELLKRNRKDLFYNLIATFISMIYIHTTSHQWANAPLEYILKATEAIDEYLQKYFPIYLTLDEKYRYSKYKFMLQYTKLSKESESFENLITWGLNRINFNDNLLIGYGIVGHNLNNELKKLQLHIFDKYNSLYRLKKNKKYKIAFICVPTPKTETEDCDISEVKNAILENDAEIYVVKSTVLPGTIEKLIQETGKNIVFSPEYYGETQHCNNYDFDFTILGGNKQDCIKVQQLLQKCYDGRHKFYITDSKTAELTKYMENSFLATKVSFCQQFYNIAEQLGINYEELRELFVLDPRVNPSHTFVYRDTPYWDSKCLNKDVPAIANSFDASLLQDIIKFNENQKNK